MIKVVGSFFILMVMISAGTVYSLKETTERLEAHKQELSAKILKDRNAIKVLRAEMAYLSQPERLKKLSSRFLALTPSHSDQMVMSVSGIAGRDEVKMVTQLVDEFPVLIPQEKPAFEQKRYHQKVHLATYPVAVAVEKREVPTLVKSSQVKKVSFYERISVKLESENVRKDK